MNASETFSTLNFADIVKKIVNVPKENVVSRKQVMDTMQMVQSLQDSNKALEGLNGQLQDENAKLLAELEALRAAAGSGGGIVPGFAPMSGGGGYAAQPIMAVKPELFIGRATLSLRSVILGKHSVCTLPLETQPGHEGALLSITTWVPSEDGVEPRKFPDTEAAFGALSGKRFDFCVLVSGAENIPEPFTDRVVCRYCFKKKENKPLTTVELKGTNPRWDFSKRYAFPDLDREMFNWLASEDVLSFEVFGYKKKEVVEE